MQGPSAPPPPPPPPPGGGGGGGNPRFWGGGGVGPLFPLGGGGGGGGGPRGGGGGGLQRRAGCPLTPALSPDRGEGDGMPKVHPQKRIPILCSWHGAGTKLTQRRSLKTSDTILCPLNHTA